MNTTVEMMAVGFNVAYIILATKRLVWCWPIGIIGSGFGIWVHLVAKLYAEAGLFVFYVLAGFYGWYQWYKYRGASGEVRITTWPLHKHFAVLVLGYVVAAVIYFILQRYTDATMPLLDAYTTSFALLATWLTARRLIENWVYWIAINGLSIYLYSSSGIQLFAGLAGLFTLLSIYGLYIWRKQYTTA